MSKDIKDANSNAAQLQTLNLDAAAPLLLYRRVHLPHNRSGGRESSLTASGQCFCADCQREAEKVTKDLNKDLVTLAEDPQMFGEAAPFLFGASFIRST